MNLIDKVGKIIYLLVDLMVPERPDLRKIISMDIQDLRQILPRAERETDKNTLSIFDYRNKTVKNLVWCIKYKNNKKFLELAGKILHENILFFAEDKMIFENKRRIALVPIPMDKKFERKRGWNQSLELCKAIAKLDQNILVLEILEKPKQTPHQQNLSRQERLKNIKNSMEIRKDGNPPAGEAGMERWKDYLPIIVDDVTTTGATLSEARRALSEIGLKDVLAATLAH